MSTFLVVRATIVGKKNTIFRQFHKNAENIGKNLSFLLIEINKNLIYSEYDDLHSTRFNICWGILWRQSIVLSILHIS